MVVKASDLIKARGTTFLDPSPSAQILCGGARSNPSQWTISNSGGFVGPLNGVKCDGKFSYVTTPTSNYTIWTFSTWVDPQGSHTSQMWVYIPNNHAGAVVDYKAFSCGHQDHIWQGINQNNLTGWYYLGSYNIPATPQGGCVITLTVSSGEVHSNYLAEDAAAWFA